MDENGYTTCEGLFRKNSKDRGYYKSNRRSMMYPRIFLARNLLRDGGVLFVATFIWEKRTTRENRRVFSFNHDFIVCYTPSKELFETSGGSLPMTEEGRKRYKNPDNDPRGDWQSVAITAQAGHETPSQFYDIITPSGRKVTLPPGNCWRVTEKKLYELIGDNRIWFGKDGNNVPRIKKVIAENPDKVITLDRLFNNDDQLKTNTALQMKDVGTEFKVV